MGEKRSIRRQIYWLGGAVVLCLLLFLISQIFLNPSSVGNPRFISNFNLWAAVWALDFLIVLALSFFLLRNLIKLLFEYRHERIGSKIKVKLVTVLVVLSLLPSVLLFFIAFGLINRTLTQWFNAPGEQILTASEVVAESYYSELSVKNRLLLERLRDQLAKDGGFPPALLRETLVVGNFDFVYWKDGSQTFSAGSFSRALDPELWARSLASPRPILERYREPTNPTAEGFITVLPLPNGVIATLSTAPKSVAFRIAQVREAAALSRQTGGNLRALKGNYFILLGLTTLIVMCGFAWFGLYTAKKITVPIEALAEGSRQVASGHLGYRIDCQAMDELGVLVDSFNRMTAQLEANRREIESSSESLQIANAELEARKNFIETILQNIGTAVLSLDEEFRIQTANKAAGKLFNRDERQLPGKYLADLIPGDERQQVEALLRRARLFGAHRQELTLSHHVSPLHVAVTANSHLDPSRGKINYLVVLDDLTELIQAQKFSAWQEVARRLAHEIKNPLTPIQLTAERLLKRFRKLRARPGARPDPAEDELEALVEESTSVIGQETHVLKEMVDEFSRFARLPLSRPVPGNIHGVIDDTLNLYEGRFAGLRIERHYAAPLFETAIDSQQMKRVFVNLIDNALEAMDGSEEEKIIEIRTTVRRDREVLQIEVVDHGPGIAAEDYDKLFLPYFSTKKRGTGLGLAIVRQIISEHHGNIRAEANVPQGTRFIIELPVATLGQQSRPALG